MHPMVTDGKVRGILVDTACHVAGEWGVASAMTYLNSAKSVKLTNIQDIGMPPKWPGVL
jgi:hypothetical protein